MKTFDYWPVIPQPLPDEVLGSWLHRVASVYGVPLFEFLQLSGIPLDRQELQRINLYASPITLRALATKSGQPFPRLHRMTLANWIAPLRRGLTEDPSPTFAQYIRGNRLFDWDIDVTSEELVPKIAWEMSSQGGLECPVCVSDYDVSHQRSTFHFCLIGSCPRHLCEHTSAGLPASTLLGPRPADAITHAVLTTGKGTLPSGSTVTADRWFRFLRSLICELEQHPGFRYPLSPQHRAHVEIWHRAGVVPPRARNTLDWFEMTGLARRRELLALANSAVDLLLRGELKHREAELRLLC